MSLVVFLPVVAGVLLHLYTVASKAERPFDGFLLGLFMWSCLPYLTAALLPKLRIRQGVAAGFAVGAIAGDLYMHYAAFWNPRSSTTPLGLLFMPLWNLVLLGPVGMLIAWALLRIRGHTGAV